MKKKAADIPARINKLLVHFGVNQKRFALMLRISESMVKRWQRGMGVSRADKLPTFHKLEKLMRLAQDTFEKENLSSWYQLEAWALGMATPIDYMIKNDNGIEEVTSLVGRIHWGITS